MTKAIDDSPTVALRDLIADMSSSGRKIVDLTAGSLISLLRQVL